MWKSTFKIVREANKAKFCKILYFCIVNDTRCLALFVCKAFCAVLNQFIWEATKWKRKREVKGISFTKNGDFIGGRINRWARLLFLREHLIRSNQGAVWQTINQILFQDISDPEKDNLRLGFSILLVNYLSTAYN